MEKPTKLLLPSPDFGKKLNGNQSNPKAGYLPQSGMTLHARDPAHGRLLQKQIQKKFVPPVPKQPVSIEQRPFCEVCDMEFATSDKLRFHRSQHEPCPVDGCTYRGHALVMDKHVTALHASGLFDKFKKLSTPEEIATWREERRKRYPTVANVEMRQKAQEQRQKRGERLEENKSSFGKRDNRRQIKTGQTEKGPDGLNSKRPKRVSERRQRKRKQMQEKRDQNRTKTECPPPAKVSKENGADQANEEIVCDGVRMFKGTSAMKDYKHVKGKTTTTSNALTSLLGMYGSDHEDSEVDDSEEGDHKRDVQATNAKVEEDKCTPKCFTEYNSKDEGLSEQISRQLDSVNGKLSSQKEFKDTIISPSTDYIEEDSPNCSLDFNNEQNKELPNETSKEKPNCHNPSSDNIERTSLNHLPDDDDGPDEVPISHNSEEAICGNHRSDNIEIISRHLLSDVDDGPDEMPIARHSDLPLPTKENQMKISNDGQSGSSPMSEKMAQKPKKEHKQKSGLDYRKVRLRKQNTLLEKLLQPDIRHERNVLLQCVRHMCENDFFGIGGSKKPT